MLDTKQPNTGTGLAVEEKSTGAEVSSREAILDAALVEFSSQGFAGTSVRSIGKRANVDFTLITYYFKTKDNLWKAVVDRAMVLRQARIAEMSKVTESMTPGQQLRARIKVEHDFASSKDAIFRLILIEQFSGEDRAHWFFEKYAFQSNGELIPLIKAAQESGEIAEGAATMMAALLQNSVRTMRHFEAPFKKITGIDPASPETHSAFWEMFDKVFFAGVNPISDS